MQHIETVVVGSGGAASITFSAIAADWTDLLVVLSLRSDSGGSVRYRLNNQVGSFYTMRTLNGSGSSASSASEAIGAFNSGWAGGITTPSFTASTFASTQFYLPNYLSSAQKSISIEGLRENNATATLMSIIAGLSTITDSVNRLDFFPDSGSFVEHSSASLFGITAGSDGTTTVS